MKSKIAYLRGLMDGMQLPDDNNGKLLRAIADCLDAIADEVEVESARTDIIEEELDYVGDEVDEIEEVLEELLDDEDEEDEDEFGKSCDDRMREILFGAPDPDECCGHHPHHHGPCGQHHHGPCGHHHGPCEPEPEHWFDEDEDEEDWLDEFNYFTCPECGEIVPLDDEALESQSDPICPKCNAHLFSVPEEKPEDKE